MGFEYSCVPTDELTFSIREELKESILANTEWVQVKTADFPTDTLYLRFVTSPIREDWLEDVVVTISKKEIYVVFYSGHGNKEHHFLSAVQDFLLVRSVTCQFYEL